MTKHIDRFLVHLKWRYLVRYMYGFLFQICSKVKEPFISKCPVVYNILFSILWEKGCSLQNLNLFKGRESEISKIFCCATFNLEIGGQNSTLPLCTGWLKVALRITAQFCWSYVHRTLDLLVSGYELWFFTSRAKSCCLWELSPDSCIFIMLLEM